MSHTIDYSISGDLLDQMTLYYYNTKWQVLTTTNGAGDNARNYVYGNYIDETLVRANIANGTGGVADKYYYAHNHLYSCVALLDNNGAVVERYEYNAYGKPIIYNAAFSQTYTTSQYNNDILFTGREVDFLDAGSLTLQYNRNRYYDYDTGRWITQDPLGVVPNAGRLGNYWFWPVRQYDDGLSLYEYIESGPIFKSDYTGLRCGKCSLNDRCCREWKPMFLIMGYANTKRVKAKCVLDMVREISPSESTNIGVDVILYIISLVNYGEKPGLFAGALPGTIAFVGIETINMTIWFKAYYLCSDEMCVRDRQADEISASWWRCASCTQCGCLNNGKLEGFSPVGTRRYLSPGTNAGGGSGRGTNLPRPHCGNEPYSVH